MLDTTTTQPTVTAPRIAAWKNETKTTFDTARLKSDRPDLHGEYNNKVTVTRPFKVRW